MKNRKNSPVSFGITLVPDNRNANAETDPEKRRSAVRRKNALPRTTEQVPIHEFDCPRRKMPQPDRPFTPDMFTCESRPLPAFPPQEKMSPKEERIRKELERSRSRTASQDFRSGTAWHPSPGKSAPSAVSVPWELFKIICAGVFVALKYAFIAVALIITIGCMICAGKHTGGLK